MRLTFALVLSVAFFSLGSSASAWNDAGHLVIARIAWERLNGDERRAVVHLLQSHPHFESLLAKGRHHEATQEEWAFLRAGIWADQIRPPRTMASEEIGLHPTHRFHRGPWHYVNFAYRAGKHESHLPEKPIVGSGLNATHILEQLDQSMHILMVPNAHDSGRASDVTDEQNRAVRLCWLFHLVGDVHQPLHTITLVDEEKFPTGNHSDQGGNLALIRTHAGASPRKLHAYWDDRLGTDSHFPAIRNMTELLTHDPQLSPENLPELRQHLHFKDWAAESYQIGKSIIYRDGHLRFAQADDFDRDRITAEEVPTLPQGTEAEANKVARRRIVLAGYRLAEKLKEIVNR